MKSTGGQLLTQEKFLSFQSGDRRVFEYVYNSYYELLIRQVFRLCREKEVAEEIVQESFTQLFLNRGNLKDMDGIYPYLYVVSKRLAISNFRKKVLQTAYQSYLHVYWSEGSNESQDTLDQKDLGDMVDRLVDRLPHQQKLIYRMSKFDEKTYQEIADEIGISKNTVRNHIASATRIIRLKLSNLLFLLFFLN